MDRGELSQSVIWLIEDKQQQWIEISYHSLLYGS